MSRTEKDSSGSCNRIQNCATKSGNMANRRFLRSLPKQEHPLPLLKSCQPCLELWKTKWNCRAWEPWADITHQVTVGITLGLLIGKPLGIAGFVGTAVALGRMAAVITSAATGWVF